MKEKPVTGIPVTGISDFEMAYHGSESGRYVRGEGARFLVATERGLRQVLNAVRKCTKTE